jgi:hypothetical protein
MKLMSHADQPNKKTSNACGVIAIWDTDVLVFFFFFGPRSLYISDRESLAGRRLQIRPLFVLLPCDHTLLTT